MSRWTFPAAALVAAMALPAAAQDDPDALLAEIEAQLSAYEAHIEGLEAQPPAPGSERAARAEIARIETRLATLAQERAEVAAVIAVRQAEFARAVAVATAGWDEAVAAPVPAPAPLIEPVGRQGEGTVTTVPEPTRHAQDDSTNTQSDLPRTDIMIARGDGGVTALSPVTPDPVQAPGGTLPSIPASAPISLDGLPRRVLTLPDAPLLRPGQDMGETGEILPTFTVLYVFDEREMDGEPWLAVGEGANGATGWTPARAAEDWKSMLIMRFANTGDRSRALFFAEREALHDIAYDAEFDPARIDAAYARAELGQSTEGIVSIEPSVAVDTDAQPYFMPITDFERFYFEESGIDALMLELASINSTSRQNRADDQVAAGQAGSAVITYETIDTATLEDFRVGVGFVIDTTRSMGPYIERAQNFVLAIEDRLDAADLADRFDFALVGYRDNTSVVEGVEYLTRVYRDFGRSDSADALRRDVMAMKPAQVSTRNWREDAFAGLQDAILQLDWGQVDTRIVFLITDASPRSVGDELARDARLGPESILAMAEQNNIALMVLHMQTEDARRISLSTENYDDHQLGQSLYRRLQGTGIGTLATYFQVRGDSAVVFERTLDRVASEVARALGLLAGGQAIARPELDDPFTAALMANPSGVTIDETQGDRQVARAVVSELFRYQQEFLGERARVEAPDFHRAWTLDRDLRDPEVRMLEVYSFMTREHLGDLYAELSVIVEALDAQESGVGDFFEDVRIQSGQATIEPSIGELLPEYLRGLPYRSFFMNLDRQSWDALPFQQKEEILDSVRDKLNSYRLIFQTEAGWLRLSDRPGSEEVYPLPLAFLP